MATLYILFVVGLLTLMAITQLRSRMATEAFADVVASMETPTLKAETLETIQELLKMDPTKMRPSPEFFQTARSLLDKYDKPELWTEAVAQIGADPGTLARQHLGIRN